MYFQAVRDKSKMMWVVRGERGGVVPQELQGKFTKKQFADDAINAYEAGKKNAKVSKGTSKRGRATGSKSGEQELQGSGPED